MSDQNVSDIFCFRQKGNLRNISSQNHAHHLGLFKKPDDLINIF